jgi:flagellar biosynthesis chaperone FliJ
MSRPGQMRNLLKLRRLEEERAEAELRKHRQSRDSCYAAIQSCEMRAAEGLRSLHAALECGDRAEALSAEMELAWVPLERRSLQRHMLQLDALIDLAAISWQDSRVRRLQVETIGINKDTQWRKETQVCEQKAMDSWFLSSQLRRSSEEQDESFQRMPEGPTAQDGKRRAMSVPR